MIDYNELVKSRCLTQPIDGRLDSYFHGILHTTYGDKEIQEWNCFHSWVEAAEELAYKLTDADDVEKCTSNDFGIKGYNPTAVTYIPHLNELTFANDSHEEVTQLGWDEVVCKVFTALPSFEDMRQEGFEYKWIIDKGEGLAQASGYLRQIRGIHEQPQVIYTCGLLYDLVGDEYDAVDILATAYSRSWTLTNVGDVDGYGSHTTFRFSFLEEVLSAARGFERVQREGYKPSSWGRICHFLHYQDWRGGVSSKKQSYNFTPWDYTGTNISFCAHTEVKFEEEFYTKPLTPYSVLQSHPGDTYLFWSRLLAASKMPDEEKMARLLTAVALSRTTSETTLNSEEVLGSLTEHVRQYVQNLNMRRNRLY